MKVRRVDILHDVGRSLNPAIDIGQIEGGFVQGMGWLTTEELVFDARRPAAHPRALDLQDPDRVATCRQHFEIALWDGANREDTIYRSKAVGEPPLMLAISVFSAIADAIHSLDPASRCRSTRRRRRSDPARRAGGDGRADVDLADHRSASSPSTAPPRW